MDKKQKSEARALEIETILKNIEQGKLETFTCAGLSPVWKKFVKLRDVNTKMVVEYVQCRVCKCLVPYASQTGTSNLLKHKCKPSKDENFKNLPDEKVRHVKSFLTNMIIGASAVDFFPTESFCGSGFLRMAQGLVSLGEKYGNIDVKAIYPSINSINRQIDKTKEETRQSLLGIFKHSFDRGWCSSSLEICNSNGIVKKPLLAVFCIHYFKKDLTALKKRSLFAIGIDPEEEPTATLKNIVRNFNIFGGIELQLQQMKIVTPNIMKTVFMHPYERQDCIVYKINRILDAAFNNSSNNKNECNEIIKNCQNIVRYMRDCGKCRQLEINVNTDCETWKSKIEMLEAVSDQYENIMKVLDDDEENNFILNKKRTKEIVSFVSPFLEAIEDLGSTEYPTANKVVLWWALLNNHLQDIDSYSFWMKDVMNNVKSIFDLELYPTMGNKIDCFLDPRYRWLKMFPQSEREAVYAKVRDMLHDIAGPSVRDAPSCNSSTEHTRPSKKSRFSKFESTEMDVDKNDEVTMYLQAADVQTVDFQLEFNMIEVFWKLAEKNFPKLFHLALSRLHVPACCGNFDRSGYVEEKLTLGKLNDFMIIGPR